MSSYEVVVVGGGIGGVGAAALLAKRGYSVLLIEKNNKTGGKCTSYEKGGFTLPTFIHGFAGVDVGYNAQLARALGEPLEWTKIYSFPFNLQGRGVDIPLQANRNLLKVFGALDIGYLELVKSVGMARAFLLSDEKLAAEYDDVDIWSWINRHTRNKKLLSTMAFFAAASFVVPPWEGSAGEIISIMRSFAKTGYIGYPVNECSSVPDVSRRAFEGAGGEYRRAKIKKIHVQNNQARAVELDDGEIINASVIISNAGIKTTMLDMVDKIHLPKAYLDRVARLKGSWSALTVKLALDKKIADGVGGFYVPTLDPEKYFAQLQAGEVPDEMALWITIPSNYSPKLAPEGKQLICLGSPVPYREDVDWTPYIEKCVEMAVKIYPQIPKHLMWQDNTTPTFLERTVGREGALIDAAQVKGQVGKDRPSIVTPIDGLFLAGSDVGGRTIGVEMAAQSAISCAAEVERKLKKPES
jgi:prolycopene isomerase